MIGDGSKVNVWSDSWLRDKDFLKIQITMTSYMHGLQVCDLFMPNDKCWDKSCLENNFDNADVDRIINTPLLLAE